MHGRNGSGVSVCLKLFANKKIKNKLSEVLLHLRIHTNVSKIQTAMEKTVKTV